MSTAKLIFAKAAVQPDGDPLVVTCTSFSEAERIRVGLYRERNKLFKTDPVLAARIFITRTKNSRGQWTIIVGAEEPKFTLETASGKPVDIFQRSDLKEREVERRLRLMREDGYSEEDIEKERSLLLESDKANSNPSN